MKRNKVPTETICYNPYSPDYQITLPTYIGPKKNKMKLTKKTLEKKIQSKLIEFGYTEVSDSISVADLLYVKIVNHKLYLSLGLTLSNYYDSRFTGAFYLSKTTIWSAIWGDIPKKSYARIGRFLGIHEKEKLLSEEFNKVGINDAWWNGDDDNSINNFLSAVAITERRFLEQSDLIFQIDNSHSVDELYMLSQNVIKEVNNFEKGNFEYQYLPTKPIKGIPEIWFMCAESVLDRSKVILNKKTVLRLAGDAWRQNIMLKSKIDNADMDI